jgi:small subunit ribosomal protein S20
VQAAAQSTEVLFKIKKGNIMAQHKSAEKRARQSIKRRTVNKEEKSEMKTLLKKVRAEKDKEKASAALKEAVSTLDKLASKGLIHKNKAANQKSKLTKHVNKLGGTQG